MNLRSLRLASNLTQKQLAQKMGITQFTYSNYENENTQPDIKLLVNLADFYHVTLDYLVGRDFANDIGYLNDQDRELIENFKQLNAFNKEIILANTKTALAVQLSQ